MGASKKSVEEGGALHVLFETVKMRAIARMNCDLFDYSSADGPVFRFEVLTFLKLRLRGFAPSQC
jgi:hypothetical protein